jgi:hypothetical protein
MKLGLLRWLAAPSPFSRSHRLGVVWFRVSDDGEDAAGAIVRDLDPSAAASEDLRSLDSDLYGRLHAMVAGGHRSVGSLAACGALPADTLYFDRVLSFADLAPTDRASRIVRRERWFHEAMVAVEPCSLVFLDPDHGLRRDDCSVPSHRNLAERHAYLSEVGRLLDRGQSVVVSHHAVGGDPVEARAASAMADIHDALGVEPLAAVRAPRGTNRLFLVIPHPRHRRDLEERLGALQLSRWGDELRLHRWRPDHVFA